MNVVCLKKAVHPACEKSRSLQSKAEEDDAAADLIYSLV